MGSDFMPAYKNLNGKIEVKEMKEVKTDKKYTNISLRTFIPDILMIQKEKIESLANCLDFYIYPDIIRWLKKHNPNIKYPKLTLIFDNLTGTNKAFVIRKYKEEYNLNAITLDINSINNELFLLTLIHEVQHVLNNYYRGNNQYEEDWINEGLSELFVYHFTSTLPLKELEKFRNSSYTKSLLDFDGSQKSYTTSFLFMAWMYFHFGKDEFLFKMITSSDQGIQNIEKKARAYGENTFTFNENLYSFKSLYLNFSIALFFNSSRIGKEYFFSITSNDITDGVLSKIKVAPKLLYINKLMNNQLNLKVSPYQSYYYKLFPIKHCYDVHKQDGLSLYKVRMSHRTVTIDQVDEQLCVEDEVDTYLIVSNLNTKIKDCTILP